MAVRRASKREDLTPREAARAAVCFLLEEMTDPLTPHYRRQMIAARLAESFLCRVDIPDGPIERVLVSTVRDAVRAIAN